MKAIIYGYNQGENYLLVWQKKGEKKFRVKELTEDQFWLPFFDNIPYRNCYRVKVNGKIYGNKGDLSEGW